MIYCIVRVANQVGQRPVNVRICWESISELQWMQWKCVAKLTNSMTEPVSKVMLNITFTTIDNSLPEFCNQQTW